MKSPSILLLASLFSGCVPLRQEALVSGAVPPLVSLQEDKSVLVGIDLGKESIIPDGSYVLSPTGARYSIRVKPHDYDLEGKSSPTRARVYLYDVHGQQLRRWKNGVWSFHFKIAEGVRNKVLDQQWKYWTFYYCPIIHGPMN